MKRTLFLAVSLLASPVHLFASPIFHLITESDPGGLNNVVLSSYDSFGDPVNLSAADTSAIFGSPSAVSCVRIDVYRRPSERRPGTGQSFASHARRSCCAHDNGNSASEKVRACDGARDAMLDLRKRDQRAG
jgi:hypothetical protein